MKNLHSELSSDKFEIEISKLNSRGIKVNDEFYVKQFNQYEEIIKPLCEVCSTIANFDDENYGKIFLNVMENSFYHSSVLKYDSILKKLENYPLYILNNVIGVIALSNNHYELLSSILLKPRIAERDTIGNISRKPIVEYLSIWNVLPDLGIKYPFNLVNPHEEIYVFEHVYNFIFEQVSEYIPNDLTFAEELQKFKFLEAMVLFDLVDSEKVQFLITPYIREINLLEHFKENELPSSQKFEAALNMILEFIDSGKTQGNDWILIKAGFFRGDIERFNECYEKISKHPDLSRIQFK